MQQQLCARSCLLLLRRRIALMSQADCALRHASINNNTTAQIKGTVTYNKKTFDEFVVERTSAYVDQVFGYSYVLLDGCLATGLPHCND